MLRNGLILRWRRLWIMPVALRGSVPLKTPSCSEISIITLGSKMKREKFDYSKAEKESKDKAAAAGVKIPENYEPPYTLAFESKLAVIESGVSSIFHFEDLEGKKFFSHHDQFEGMPRQFWRVVIWDQDGEGCWVGTDWFQDKRKARRAMEQFNVRHFNIMAMSTNKDCPVLI